MRVGSVYANRVELERPAPMVSPPPPHAVELQRAPDSFRERSGEIWRGLDRSPHTATRKRGGGGLPIWRESGVVWIDLEWRAPHTTTRMRGGGSGFGEIWGGLERFWRNWRSGESSSHHHPHEGGGLRLRGRLERRQAHWHRQLLVRVSAAVGCPPWSVS